MNDMFGRPRPGGPPPQRFPRPEEFRPIPCPGCGELRVRVERVATICIHRLDPTLTGIPSTDFFYCLGCGARRDLKGAIVKKEAKDGRDESGDAGAGDAGKIVSP